MFSINIISKKILKEIMYKKALKNLKKDIEKLKVNHLK